MASSMRRYFCKLCGAAYTTANPNKLYCCDEHRKEQLNIRILGGLALYDLAVASRLDRSAGQEKRNNELRRYLYDKITELVQDERARRTKRQIKIDEIRSGRSNLPQPIEREDDDALPDFSGDITIGSTP